MLATEKMFREQGWPISISIGSVTDTGKKKSVEELLREADEKMYSLKNGKLQQRTKRTIPH